MKSTKFILICLFIMMGNRIFSQRTFIVAKDGTGEFTSVQAALDAVPEGNDRPFTIWIRNGIYKEVIVVDARKSFIRMIGEDPGKTILSFNNHAGTKLPNGDTLNTWTCASFFIYGNDFHAENMTFENNAGFTAGQAVALRIEGNRASFINCRMLGNQDVLFLSGSGVKHYFRDCYIEGTTDFIFGAATAVFKNCHIHSRKNSHVTAASTNSIIPYGFVFFDCKLTADSNINKVSLGRPWSPTASVTYIRCWMGKHIVPEGWNNWKNPANELTARYAEYQSSGPGADPTSRVKWSRQLTEKELKSFELKNILGDWNPEQPDTPRPAPGSYRDPIRKFSREYKNPIIHADYSDPDAIRVGNDYYMVSSSFNAVPGIPILHSKDLVNWTLIGHALSKLVPEEHFRKVQHGGGVWAPSIRYHNNEFYIFYPDPDFGIYLIKSKKILGPWSEPVLVESGKGLIDPCPLWDEDGKVYLVHAYAGSRAGIKSILVIRELNKEATRPVGQPVLVYDGHIQDPTVEGPKLYKYNGYYYIFAPAGGVSTGWQLVLRSRNIYGPYERRNVMDQGKTNINGPHQGAWVETNSGEHWFIHFQDKKAYGRIVHLQPMRWKDGWPVIGNDPDADGRGEPVLSFTKPVHTQGGKENIQLGDEFNGISISPEWQWQANPGQAWAFLNKAEGKLRLYGVVQEKKEKNIWMMPNMLLQKFPAEEFNAEIKFRFNPNTVGEKFGFVVMGTDYAYIAVEKRAEAVSILFSMSKSADKGNAEETKILSMTGSQDIVFNIRVEKEGVCHFGYKDENGKQVTLSPTFIAKPGKWIGAKFGIFCSGAEKTNDSGFADIDWIRIKS